MDKDKIRNIIELFIAWNGETEPIDVANIDSAVKFIDSSLQEEPVSEDFDALDKLLAKYAIDFSYKGKTLKECSGRYKAKIIATANHLEPVSEDLEEASKKWLSPQLDKSYAAYGETKQMELTHFDGYAMLDAIEFGAQWQKVKHERQFSFINLKDCKDAYNEWKGTQKEPVSAALSWVRACQWQKQQDQSTIELAEDHAYFAGRTKTIDEIKESLLSEVLPCFMHGREADEVMAKLNEVLNFQKK